MNKNRYTVLDSAASLYIPDTLDLFPQVKAQLAQRRTFMQTLRARPALAIVLAFLALILLTGVAYAISRSLGYIPGIGFVEQGAKIRVLAEPVSQTRESITVSIEQVIVDSQRTVVVYKAEGLSLQAANSQGEGADTYHDNLLRLPDGTLLQETSLTGYDGTPEPLIDDLTTENGWPNYVRRLVYPAVDPQINELTLVLPALQNMPAGAAPENWEITFSLKPAPPDMIVIPITVLASQAAPVTADTPPAEATQAAPLSNVSTLNGVTLSLDNVIEVEDGFIFTGKIKWEASPFPPHQGLGINFSEVLTLSDGNGQNVPIEEVPLNAAYNEEHERPWSFRTDRKSFVGPLVFSISALKTNFTTPPFEFELDLGPNPQVGQIWELNREFPTGGEAIRIPSVELVKDSNSNNFCLAFDLENTTWGGFVKDLDSDPAESIDCYDENGRSYGGSGSNGKPISIFTQTVGYHGIPSGLHRFSLDAFASFTLPGPWQVAWEPPLSSEPSPTAVPEVCLTLDKWNEVMGQNEALPERLGGKVLTTVNEGSNLPAIYVSSLDGTNSQRIDEGSWPSLSRDGTRLVYSSVDALRMVDLASGQIFGSGIDGYGAILSPDNSRILYTTTFNLYVVNVDGTGLQMIDTGAAQVIAPVGWLPDNLTIIYSAMGGDGFHYKSYNLQSGEQKELFVANNKAGLGAISPDGQWIVFSDRVFGALAPSTFISKIDGSGRRQITAPEIMSAVAAAWSPDGQWLLFNVFNPDETQSHVLVNPFTCQALRVNTIKGMVEDWSP